jgi:hypothetical protein
MTEPIPILIAVEDLLSEAVARVLLDKSSRSFFVNCIGRKGAGYIKKNITSLNNTAKGYPVFVLTDLDYAECPPSLIRDWLPHTMQPNLIFRVAVREVESWLLADRKGVAQFFGIKTTGIRSKPDEIMDPKQYLINLASKSRKRTIREAIVPATGSTAKIGPDYNGALIEFVYNKWQIKEATKNSTSLQRTLRAIQSFRPSRMSESPFT